MDKLLILRYLVYRMALGRFKVCLSDLIFTIKLLQKAIKFPMISRGFQVARIKSDF